MRVRFFNFFRKHYIFFRGGVDIKNPKNLQKVKHIFKKAYKVEVRDENSYNILQKLGMRVSMKPDPVFYDNSCDIVNFEEEAFK
jgi:polysaccharide pyruvyl transferase WcaK-like protein